MTNHSPTIRRRYPRLCVSLPMRLSTLDPGVDSTSGAPCFRARETRRESVSDTGHSSTGASPLPREGRCSPRFFSRVALGRSRLGVAGAVGGPRGVVSWGIECLNEGARVARRVAARKPLQQLAQRVVVSFRDVASCATSADGAVTGTTGGWSARP